MTVAAMAGTFVPPTRLESRRLSSRGAGMNRTCINITTALVAMSSLMTVSPTTAQQSFAHWPRQCRGDLARICRDVAKQEDKAILTCLQDNEIKLSQACRKLLQSYGHVPETPGKRR